MAEWFVVCTILAVCIAVLSIVFRRQNEGERNYFEWDFIFRNCPTHMLIRLIKQIGTCFCSFEKVCYASCCQFVGLPVHEKYNLSNTFFHLLPSFPSSPAHTHSHLGVGLMCKSAYNTYYYEIISYPGM